MKFEKYKELKGKIELLSGLHIGGNKDNIEIGGIDDPVIKNPVTGRPYIPGSSIKGKMRFLLEWKEGKVTLSDKGKPHGCLPDDGTCPICRIFGNTAPDKTYGPTRLIINDCKLLSSKKEEGEKKSNEWVYLEDKVENRVNRLTGSARDPRHMERVPAGMVFDFGLTYKIFLIGDGKDIETCVDETNWQKVLDALYFLQQDALGGSGSRGYGKIKFFDLILDGDDSQLYELAWNGSQALLKKTEKIGE